MLKKHWAILTRAPQFDMNIQAKVPPALAALHNFILDHDPHNINEYLSNNPQDDLDPNPGQPQDNEFGELADGAVTRLEKERAITAWNQIAELMWRDYLRMRAEEN